LDTPISFSYGLMNELSFFLQTHSSMEWMENCFPHLFMCSQKGGCTCFTFNLKTNTYTPLCTLPHLKEKIHTNDKTLATISIFVASSICHVFIEQHYFSIVVI
jgi:hypothetical protein